MNLQKQEKNQTRYFKLGVTLFSVGVLLILVYYLVNNVPVIASGLSKLNSILMPFYLGITMAYLLCPVYNNTVKGVYKISKGKFKTPAKDFKLARFVATIISVLIIVAFVGGMIMLIIPALWESLTSLAQALPEGIKNIVDWGEKYIDAHPELMESLNIDPDSIYDKIINWGEVKLLPKAYDLINGISTGLIGTFGVIIDFVVGLIICVYILNSKEMFIAQTKKISIACFKPQNAQRIFEFGKFTNDTFGGFINGKIIDSVIIGIICFVVMTILRLPFSVLISVIIGITNIIPFFGPFIGAIPSTILLLVIQPMSALKFLIMIVVLQQFDGNILGPKIIGKSTNLASFWVIFAIIVGGGLFGFIGMILGIPVFAIIYFYIQKNIDKKLKTKNISSDINLYMDLGKYNADKEVIFGKESIKCNERKNSKNNKFEKQISEHGDKDEL